MKFNEIRTIGEDFGGVIDAASNLWSKLKPPVQQPTQTATGNNVVPVQQISSYLASRGLSDNHRIGILANIKRESQFNSGVIGDNGTSGGLFQHHAERFKSMIAACGGPSRWQSNWKGQIDFALSEPAGQSYLQQRFRTPHDAVEWFTRYFENPAHQGREVAIRKSYVKNHPTY